MTLPAAAAAALGLAPPLAQPERLAWVDVESGPRMVAVIDPTSGEPLGQYAEVDDDFGMTDRMADKFRAICDSVDDNCCEASDCVASPVPVGCGIGWVLAGDADERVEWSAMALVQRGRVVLAVCEECSPSWRYQGLWSEE